MIPTVWHSGEGTPVGTVRRSVVAGLGEGVMNGQGTERFFTAVKLFYMIL